MGSFLAAADPKMADFVGQEQEPEWLADITGEGKLFFVSTAFVTVHRNKCFAVINPQCVETGDFGGGGFFKTWDLLGSVNAK